MTRGDGTSSAGQVVLSSMYWSEAAAMSATEKVIFTSTSPEVAEGSGERLVSVTVSLLAGTPRTLARAAFREALIMIIITLIMIIITIISIIIIIIIIMIIIIIIMIIMIILIILNNIDNSSSNNNKKKKKKNKDNDNNNNHQSQGCFQGGLS